MKQVDKMPTEGAFVAIWIHNNEPWCDSYRWDGNKLYVYDEYTDKFNYCGTQEDFFRDHNACYYVIDEGMSLVNVTVESINER